MSPSDFVVFDIRLDGSIPYEHLVENGGVKRDVCFSAARYEFAARVVYLEILREDRRAAHGW